MLCLTLRPVNDKGKLLKRKEADAKWQQNMLQRKVCLKNRIHIFKKEIVILQIKQNAKV